MQRLNKSRIVLLSALLLSRIHAVSSLTSPKIIGTSHSSLITTMSMSSSSTTTISSNNLFRRTPLIHSLPLSQLANRPVYCKLDALQESGSFKDRGVAYLCESLQSNDGISKLISSSGGNAGLAVATMGRKLKMQVQVIVPETTKQIVIDKLQSLGAQVTVHGENWNAADTLARSLVEQANNSSMDVETSKRNSAAYVSPYDHPLLWTGHSSVVDEILEDMEMTPAAVLVSVGGGGLLCGVLEGLQRHKVQTTVIAAETEGACSFGKALEKGKVVRLEGINTIATSLGALEVTPVTLERSKEYSTTLHGVVTSAICTDAEAVNACVKFAQDHRILVEPACGAALAVLYSERLRKQFLESLDDQTGPIVVEVCGGSGVNLDLLYQWKSDILGT